MARRPDLPLLTDRLELRGLTDDDVPALLAYRGDPEICRYLPFEPMTADRLHDRLAADLGRTEITEEGQGITLGAFRRDTGELVGDVVLFHRSDENRRGELGYVFHPAHHGKGYATEAATAVLDWAFDPAGLNHHRVIAQLDPRNTASGRLAARLGMRHEAHFVHYDRFKGEWGDLDVYAILEGEWRARRGLSPTVAPTS